MPKRICVCGRDDTGNNKEPVVIRITKGCNKMHACVDGKECLNGSNSNLCVSKLRDSKSRHSSSNKQDKSPTNSGTEIASKNDDKSKKNKKEKNEKKTKKKDKGKEQKVYYMNENSNDEPLPINYPQYYKKFPDITFTDPQNKVSKKNMFDADNIRNSMGGFPKVEFECPDEILRLGDRPSQKLITYGPTSFREHSRHRHLDANDCMLPEVPGRYHGHGCAIEISVLEKHDSNCRYAKKPNSKRHSIDDRSGSYEVIGRIAYQTCNGNQDVTKSNNITEMFSFISDTLSVDNKNNNFTVNANLLINKNVTKAHENYTERKSLMIKRSRSYSGPSTSKNIAFNEDDETETVRTVIIGVITSNKAIQMTPRQSRVSSTIKRENHGNKKWYLHIFSCCSSAGGRDTDESYYPSSSRMSDIRELMLI